LTAGALTPNKDEKKIQPKSKKFKKRVADLRGRKKDYPHKKKKAIALGIFS